MLKIELAQLQWKVDVTRRVLPEIPLLESSIAQLKKYAKSKLISVLLFWFTHPLVLPLRSPHTALARLSMPRPLHATRCICNVTRHHTPPLREIAVERRRNAKLSFDLENPSNASRWRLLAGRDLDKDELALKFAEIEERLSAKKDMLDEKELVLSETSQLIEVLRGQATEGREETINTAKIVNDIQARIKAVTRKMIA